MILTLAKLGVFFFALWLIFVAIYMLFWPRRCLRGLRKMGSTPAIHFGEHFLRGLAGLSLMGIAAQSSYSKVYLGIGVFLLATSVIIVLAPRGWHHSYAVYWADRVSPRALRWMAPVPFAVGWYLQWVVLFL